MHNFLIYRCPAVLWMLVIYFLSSIPGPKLPPVSFPHVHLIAHLIEYGILGFLLLRSFLNSVGVAKWIFAAGTAFVIASLFAASDEYHQTFVAGRNGEIMTVLLNAGFLIFGISLFLFLEMFLERRKKIENHS